MTRQEFKNTMKELLLLKEVEENINKALSRLDTDFNTIRFGRHEELIVVLIETAMNDKNKWVSHWIYELNCGKNSKRLPVTSKNGKKIPTKTLDNLYDLINNKEING